MLFARLFGYATSSWFIQFIHFHNNCWILNSNTLQTSVRGNNLIYFLNCCFSLVTSSKRYSLGCDLLYVCLDLIAVLGITGLFLWLEHAGIRFLVRIRFVTSESSISSYVSLSPIHILSLNHDTISGLIPHLYLCSKSIPFGYIFPICLGYQVSFNLSLSCFHAFSWALQFSADT